MSATTGSGPVVGVDVGGTKVLAGVVEEDGQVRRTAELRTPGRRVDVTHVEDTLVAAVARVSAGERPAAVGVAAAGFVDAAGERVVFAPHLPWAGEPVRARLAARLGTPVVLGNDADCAALAEVGHGAAAGARTAVMVTLGTGIGGALVLDGRLHRGRHGMAGEYGHMQVVPGGEACECGGRGCWEQYCSGNALVRSARSALAAGRVSVLAASCENEPAGLTGPMVTDAARRGDPVALEAFAEVGDWLGVGVANLVSALDPDVVVVGGGVAAADDLVLAPARAALRRTLVGARATTVTGEPARVPPPLRAARLGPSAGLVGAAALARAHLAGGPTEPGPTARR